MFRTNFGPRHRHQPQQQQQQQQAAPERTPTQAAMMGFLQFLPVILLLFFSFFSATSPNFSLAQTSYYVDKVGGGELGGAGLCVGQGINYQGSWVLPNVGHFFPSRHSASPHLPSHQRSTSATRRS